MSMSGVLVITRRVGNTASLSVPDVSTSPCFIPAVPTITADKRIEDSEASAHVDFANAKIHIGCIIASATQEEVLFSLRPELLVCFVLIK